MTLRVATVDDIPAMHQIRMSVRENMLRDPSKVTPEHYRAFLTAQGRGWLYEYQGTVVGFAIADAATRNIWALFVSPAFERRGIGQALHDVMVAWLFLIDKRPVWLNTQANSRAQSFYESAGWNRVRVEPSGEIRFERKCADV